MDNTAEKPPQEAVSQPRTLAQFLETSPPDIAEEVCKRIITARPILNSGGPAAYLSTPDLQLHCEQCGGVRTFECSDDTIYLVDTLNFTYLTYECRNCRKTEKKFAVVIKG